MGWFRDAGEAIKAGWFRDKFEFITKKTGFFNSVINSFGAGVAVFYSYVSVFSKEYSIPLGIVMGIKTVFINLFISYQVFKEDKDSHSIIASNEHTHLTHGNPLINTTSSTAFIIGAGISISMDLYTNFLATQQQFEALGEKANVGSEDLIKTIAIFFALFASLRSYQFTGTFALKIWDRIRMTAPNNRFYNHCIKPCVCGCCSRCRTNEYHEAIGLDATDAKTSASPSQIGPSNV